MQQLLLAALALDAAVALSPQHKHQPPATGRAVSIVPVSSSGGAPAGVGTRAALSILDYGGKAQPGFNNQAAIHKAMAACDASPGGCVLTFPRVGTAPGPTCPTPDCLGATTCEHHTDSPPPRV